jgi:hypothetical protein
MDKQELIELIKGLKNIFGNKTKYVEKDLVIELISKLDEPQKVKVSEEEEEFLKTFDFNRENDVATALYHVSRTGWGYELTDRDGTKLKHLTREARLLENRKRLIKAILDGYEVEKEPKYIVKLKNVPDLFGILNFGKHSKEWIFSDSNTNSHHRTKHTKKQLEQAGFGWVFDCPGIEIEEIIE